MKSLHLLGSARTRASLFSLALVPLLSAQEPRFDNPVLLANREVALTLTAPSGQTYRIDASSDLTQWVALASLPVTGGQVRHTDSSAPWARDRFYVARQVTSSTALTGDHLPAAGGDVVIHPVFHSSLALSWSNQIVYPYHYRNANGSFADLESFKSQIDPRLQVEVRLRKWY